MQQTITAKSMLKKGFLKYRKYLLEGVLATLVINMLVIASSLYSMQVYDRVIPTHGFSTLITLSVGVAIAIICEFTLKLARSSLMDSVVVGLDGVYARQIYKRLLSIRLD
jgi:ATP-binding cassette subfamily C protein LapB